MFAERSRKGWFPQWHDIALPLMELGLARNGNRLIDEGFEPRDIYIPRYGTATFRCLPRQEVPKGRASPHRLQVHCTCGEWVFAGKLGQHVKKRGHK